MVSLGFWGALGIVFPSSILAFFEVFLSYLRHWRDVVSLALKWVGPLALGQPECPQMNVGVRK
jgi:hypothetical protein